jgi:hypothetical protein
LLLIVFGLILSIFVSSPNFINYFRASFGFNLQLLCYFLLAPIIVFWPHSIFICSVAVHHSPVPYQESFSA